MEEGREHRGADPGDAVDQAAPAPPSEPVSIPEPAKPMKEKKKGPACPLDAAADEAYDMDQAFKAVLAPITTQIAHANTVLGDMATDFSMQETGGESTGLLPSISPHGRTIQAWRILIFMCVIFDAWYCQYCC